MKRPIFICLLSCAFAIVLQSFICNPLLTISVLFCITFISIYLHKKYLSRIYYVFLAFFLSGIISVIINSKPNFIIENMQREENVLIKGVVVSYGYTTTLKQKLTVHTEEIFLRNISIPLKIKIQAILEENQYANAGDIVMLSGQLLDLEPARNPGGYNEKYYLGARKYSYKIYASLIENKADFNIYRLLNYIRLSLSNVYDNVLPPKEASIIRSMIIGDRTDIDEYISQLYKNAGIYHILAISGLHLSITAVAAQFILCRFLSIKRASYITIVFLISYTIFTGVSVSTVRAAVMAIIIILGKLSYKNTDIVTSACAAGIILMLYEPLYLFDIGFQYSFSAVLGIGFLTEPLEAFLMILRKNLRKEYKDLISSIVKALASSIAVFIFTIPVQIYHFNHILPWSILINLIVIPVVPFVISLGFAVGLIGIISLKLASVISGIIYFLLKLYEYIASLSEILIFSKILIATPHYTLALGFLLLIFILRYIIQRDNIKKKFMYCTGLISIYLSIYLFYTFYPRAPSITMLDVGQGDCVVIENKDKTFVVDGGGLYGRDLGNNTGSSILVPYLDYKGINTVEAAFVSHFHADHVIGIIELVRLKNVKKVYLPAIYIVDDLYLELLRACEETGSEIIYLKSGDILTYEPDINFMVLNPNSKSGNDLNESSLILYLRMSTSMMFTGDIGKSTEIELVNSYSNLNARILKIAHHGSKYSSSDEFLDATKPYIAIAGASKNNPFGHPSEETIERLSKRNINFYCTNRNGAIIITIKPEKEGKEKIKTMLGD